VLSAEGISQCLWLNLEDGVIIKYDDALTMAQPGGNYVWFREDDALGISYNLVRQQAGPLNRFFVLIVANGCIVTSVIEQDEDEQLLTIAEDNDITAFGTCAGDPPIDTLSIQSFRTQAAALVVFPDVQQWDWS